jgi:hypothetical protein
MLFRASLAGLPTEAEAAPGLKGHMKLSLLVVGLLFLLPGAVAFFVLLMRGSESILVYPTAACMYVGLGLVALRDIDVLDDERTLDQGRTRGRGRCSARDPNDRTCARSGTLCSLTAGAL